MPIPLRVMIVEDNPADTELMILHLTEAGFQPEWQQVETETAYTAALQSSLEMILCDWNLPLFNGLRALELLTQSGLEIPFIIVSGGIGEEVAIELLRKGVDDYVLKDHLARLGLSVRRALADRQRRNQRQQTEKTLRESEDRFLRLTAIANDLIYRYEITPRRGFSYVSPSATAITGFTPEEHYADPDLGFKLVHPDDRTILESVSHGKHPAGHSIVLRWIRKDGTVIWTETRNVPVLDPNGSLVALEGVARDITDRKQAEAEINLQVALLNAVGQAVIATDMNGTVTFLNRAFEELYGWAASEALGQNIMEVAVPDISRALTEEIMVSLTNGCTWSGEFMVQRRDGTVFPAMMFDAPVQDEKGKLIGIISISMDNSERKQADDALTAQRQTYEQILEQTLAGYWDWDIPTGDEYLSPTFKKMFGYEDHEIENRAESWQRLIFTEDLPSVYEKYNQHTESKGEIPFYNEVRYHHKNGSTVWVICTGKVIEWDDNRKAKRMIGCHIDITARKQAEQVLAKSEEQFRTLASLAPVGIYLTRPDGTCLYTNPNWQNMAGLSAEEALGHGWVNGIHPDDREMVFSNWQKMVESHGEWGVEYRFQNREGKTTIVFGLATAQNDASGNIVGYIGVNIDITERKRAEEEVKKANERLHLAQEASNSGAWDWDITNNNFFWSDEFLKLFGMDQHTIPGFEAWNKSLHPDDIELASNKIQESIDQKTELLNDYRIILPNKEVRWIRAIGKTLYDGGKPSRMLGLCLDVTERKQAEIFLKNLVAMNPVSMQVLDTQGFTLEVNPAFKLLFGSVPPPDYSIFNDPQLVKKGIGEIFDRLRNGEVGHIPDVSFNPHDSIPALPDVPNWIRTIGFPICSENGKPERFVLMQENITEQKIAEVKLRDSEFKFRQTFDVSPVGIVMVGLDTRFIQCNLAFAQSLGYKAEELVGKLIEDVTLPEDRQIGKADMVAMKKGEIVKSQVQKRYLRKDGQVTWGEVTISLIRDSSGQALYFLAIIQNITERKLAEQKINEQLAELRRWNNATLGREDRIMELKREVNKLLAEAGKPPHYASVVEEARG
jgi:PAS domain S-box-containing protein